MREYLTKMNEETKKNTKDIAAQRIVAHVTQMVQDGDKTLEEAIETGKRTVKGMMKYVTGEAEKQMFNGCACVDDDVVYGWAVHYLLDEPAESAQKAEKKPTENKPTEPQSTKSDKKPTETENKAVKPVKTEAKAITKPKPEPKKGKPETKQEEQSVQMSLFDML